MKKKDALRNEKWSTKSCRVNRRCFEIKPYSCLICGKRAGKENLRSPGEKGISAFVRALGVSRACNTF